MAAIKVSDVTSRVRPLIGDDIAEYRHSPASLRLYMTDGCRMIVSERPESQYITEVSNPPIVDLTTEAQSLLIDSDYLNALVEYVVSKIMIEDSEDSANLTASNNHLARTGGEMQ